nr:MAG TPA: hypothetical protein [Caudoviricetes sp.]
MSKITVTIISSLYIYFIYLFIYLFQYINKVIR